MTPDPSAPQTQLAKAKSQLRPVYELILRFDLRALRDLLRVNKSAATRPDPSIDRSAWARLSSAHRHLDELRTLLADLRLDE